MHRHGDEITDPGQKMKKKSFGGQLKTPRLKCVSQKTTRRDKSKTTGKIFEYQ